MNKCWRSGKFPKWHDLRTSDFFHFRLAPNTMQEGEQTMKPKISILLTGIFVMIIFVSVSYSQHPANQMEAYEWMQFTMENRAIYCLGFIVLVLMN